MNTPAVFLDRDGTLMEEVHYCADPSRVKLFPGAAEALRRLKAAGFRVVIVTNQSGIGRGLITPAQYEAVHAELLRQIADGGGGDSGSGGQPVDAAYFCPDAPPAFSPRRKPEPGMILEAARDLRLDVARSWMVGDKTADIECGRRAGARTILVRTGYGAGETAARPDFAASGLSEAVEIILRHRAG